MSYTSVVCTELFLALFQRDVNQWDVKQPFQLDAASVLLRRYNNYAKFSVKSMKVKFLNECCSGIRSISHIY